MKDIGQPDRTRRALIRGAAVVPLMATIPVGSAFANASAFQCVVSSKDASDAGTPSVSITTPPLSDAFVRTATKRRLFTTKNPSNPAQTIVVPAWSFQITAPSDAARTDWRVGDGTLIAPDWDGVCSEALGVYCPFGPASVDAYVLAIYQPDDPIDPTAVTAQGFYPIENTEFNGGDAGNIGLFRSCYCSVSPTNGIPGQEEMWDFYCTL